MKVKIFEHNFILSISILFGLVGGILLMLFMASMFALHIKPWYGLAIYPLAMIGSLIIYRQKANSDMNYLKSFVIAFMVFSIVTIIGFCYTSIMRYMEDGHVTPIIFAFIIFLRLLVIGIVSSLVAVLFFTNKNIHKIIAIGIIVLAIILLVVLKRYQIL